METGESSHQRGTVFFSYSRSESMLVDDLGDRLAQHGFTTWIDYEELVPGEDWEQQLDEAVDRADVVLVVISRRAVGSKHVEAEWDRAQRLRTPMILVIAEAAPLPPRLAGLPWIDVRSRYGTAVARLTEMIDEARATRAEPGTEPPPPTRAPPPHGFRAPLRVWLAFVTSIGVAASSLPAFWTVIVPVVLVPLPVRILRRRFTYIDVRNALIALPLALLITDDAVNRSSGDDWNPVVASAFAITVVAAPTLFLLIRSGSFRRWAEPVAARPRRQRAGRPGADRVPTPVRYHVDAVPEDRNYADEVDRVLAELGHERVDEDEATLTLRYVSQFHDVTELEPVRRTVPIIVADVDDKMPDRLQRTQWVDLRRGVERWKLEALGRHLDEPSELLAVIGSPPPHGEHVLPRGVQGLFVSVWVAIGTIIGYALLVALGLRSEIDVIGTSAVVWSGVLGVIAVAAMLWLTRKLRLRRPGALRASLIPLLALGPFVAAAPIMSSYEDDELSAAGVVGMDNANFVVLVPVALMLYFWLFRSGAIRRWIPSRKDDSSRDGTGRRGSTGHRWSTLGRAN